MKEDEVVTEKRCLFSFFQVRESAWWENYIQPLPFQDTKKEEEEIQKKRGSKKNKKKKMNFKNLLYIL